MSTFAARRWRSLGLILVLGVVIWLVYHVSAIGLQAVARGTGWLLLLMVVFLSLFNVRKKVPFLPLGTGSAWLQLHIYTGLLSMVVFALHVRVRLPTGLLDGGLAALFVLVAFSGVVGLVLSRTLPARLTTRGEAVLFERIPTLRVKLRDTVEGLVLQAATDADSQTIARLYTDRLMPYFAKPRHTLRYWAESRRPVQALCDEVTALERYATPAEAKLLRDIRTCVEQKSDLDYHYSLQGLLKGWLFVHLPLTYALLLVAAVHTILVHAFARTLP